MTRSGYIWCHDVLGILAQHNWFDFYSDISLKQQTADRHVAPLGYNILIREPTSFFLFSPECACLVKTQQIPITIFWNQDLSHTRQARASLPLCPFYIPRFLLLFLELFQWCGILLFLILFLSVHHHDCKPTLMLI